MMQFFADANRVKARFVLGLLVMGFLGLSFSYTDDAQAQSNRELSSRINRLENEIQTLSRALFRGEKPEAGAYSGGAPDAARADLEIRLTQLESELRSVRGQIEEQSYELRQLKDELKRVTGDIEMRVQDLENGSGGSSATSTSTSGGGAKYINRKPVLNTGALSTGGNGGYQWDSRAGGDANQLGSYTESGTNGSITGGADLAAATYENAFSLLKNEKYETAEKEFQTFLDKHSDHALAGNAKYWLGETYYVRGKYEQAARIFAEGYQKYPKNSKAADNLLKLGMSLAALGKTQDACVALSQIEKEGYKAAAPVLRRASQEKSSLGC